MIENKWKRWVYLIAWLATFCITVSFWPFFLIDYDMICLTVAIVATVLCVFIYFLMRLEIKNMKLRFYFLGEKFNTQYDKVAKKFEGASEEFLKNLKKECISNYRKTGSVINEVSVPSNAWIYRDINNIIKLKDIYVALQKSIKSKGGFVEFSKTIRDFEQEEWVVHSYLYNGLSSFELRYLLDVVFHYCLFWVNDTGISPEYTAANLETIEKLNNEYSPLLFLFKDEIDKLVDMLDENIKKNMAEK